MSATETKSKKQPKKSLSPAEKEARRAAKRAEREAARQANPPVSFRTTVSADQLDGDGRLKSANVFELGYDEEKHSELSREDFASEALWLNFRALRLRNRAASLIKKAESLEAEAQAEAQFGDPTKRAAIKKIQKMGAAFAELKSVLEKEGVDLSTVLKGLNLG